MRQTEPSDEAGQLMGDQLVEAQQNLRRCFELHEIGRELALTGLRMRFPDASEEEL